MRLLAALVLVTLMALPRTAVADDRAELAALRAGWAADLRDKRLEPSLARYAPDAVFHNPDGSSATGTAQIRTLFKQVMQIWDSDLRFDSRQLRVSGNLAYDSGDYDETLTPRSGGAALQVHGGYLMVLRKTRDGRWLIQQQMWTLQPPQPPA